MRIFNDNKTLAEQPLKEVKHHSQLQSNDKSWDQRGVTDRGPGFPCNKGEAKDHIAAIKAEKLSAIETSIARILNNVLKESAKIYSDSAHFLYELIQNADDNKYEDPTPSMRISLDESRAIRTLRIECNEIGFSRANVEAICSLSESSKRQPGQERKHIGEKGMGFKSVFAVADVVTIQSGYYSFRFVNHESEPLAMIVPHWVEPLESEPFIGTSITLQLTPKFSSANLIKKLKSMDPAFLMFLKNLKRLDIDLIQKQNSQTWAWRRSDFSRVAHGLSNVTVYSGQESTEYAMYSKNIPNLPHDDRRIGTTEAELKLVFPVHQSSRNRKDKVALVHAFLPIRDYGFKFLVHSDFILVASREDLDPSSWNQQIIKHIPSAFLEAVKGLTHYEDPIRFDWLRFIPLHQSQHEIFANLHSSILECLYQSCILESHTGSLIVPNLLTYVPKKFRDEYNIPLVPPGSEDVMYVSTRYSSECGESMKQLGVKKMSPKLFVQELSTYISKHFEKFVNQPEAWHGSLSKSLARLIHDEGFKHTDLAKLIMALKIVPLRDGRRWVSANAVTIFFPPERKVLDVPNGIDVFLIHKDACQNSQRKHLLKLLDAKDYDDKYVCESIIKTHQQKEFQPQNLAPHDLISHMRFLIASDWTSRKEKKQDMWFLVEDGSCQLGSKVYIDSPSTYSATSMFQMRRADFFFLHRGYDSALSGSSKNWRDVLCQYYMLETLPRLVDGSSTISKKEKHAISNDFHFIIDNRSSVMVLLLLREHWNHYEGLIFPKSDQNNKQEAHVQGKHKIRDFLSRMKVPCQGGAEAKLCNTVLPRRRIIYLASGISGPRKWHLFRGNESTSNTPKLYLGKLKGRVFGGAKTGHSPILQPKGLSPPRHGKSPSSIDHDTEQSHQDKHSMQTKPEFNVNQNDQDRHENRTAAKKAYNGRLFLDVPDPEDKRWDFLGYLGVTMKVDSTTVMNHLRRLSSGSATKEHVDQLYEQIEISAHDIGLETIRSTFEKEKFVFIPDSSNQRWVTIKDCVWDGPSCLMTVPRLRLQYGDRSVLFCSILKCPDASMLDLIAEANDISRHDSVEHAMEVLKQISRHLILDSEVEIKSLEKFNIFPTKLGGKAVKFSKFENTQDQWYIPDMPHVAKHFENHRFLAFDLPTINQMQPLFAALKLQRRYLSNIATRSINHGKVVRNRHYQAWFRDRMRYVKGLVLLQSHQATKYTRLRRIEVFVADRIESTWTMFNQLGKVDGQCTETVRFDLVEKEDSNKLELYLSTDDSEPGSAPIDMIVELSRYCGFKENGENAVLLSHILSPRHTSEIEKYLKSKGVSFEGREHGNTHDAPVERDMLQLPAHFRNIEGGYMDVPSPFASFEKPDLKYKAYFGELYVSKILEKILGSDYSPNNHWLSSFRTRDGYLPFEEKGKQGLRFKFLDKNRKFVEFLVQNGYSQASLMSHLPTFHIYVSTSTGNLDSNFDMTQDEVALAKTYTMVGQNDQTVSDLFIVARIANIDQTPQVALFPDPWQMHTNQLIQSESKYGYSVTFHDGAVASAIRAPDLNVSGSKSIYQEAMNPSTHIRLIEIKGSISDNRLEGEIYVVPITEPGRFWALSYVWGPPPSEQVPYYFETSYGTLIITASLNLALRKIYDRKQNVRVWADAVCINQQSSFEKALQIQLMGDIFHSSERVFAWIGAEEERSDRVMDTLARLSSPEFDASKEALFKDVADPMNKLLKRPWFKRAWVVQELVRGSNVFIVCGDSELRWERFLEAVDVHRQLLNSLSRKDSIRYFENSIGPVYALGRTRKLLVEQRQKFTLLELLEFFSFTGATREEDKLFALRGLAYDTSGQAFDPIYGDDSEVGIRKYAQAFVKEGHALDLLYRAGYQSKSYPFSSWIPKWTRGTFPRTISDWECDGIEPFYAGRRSPPEAALSSYNPIILEIRGFKVDRIASLTEIEVYDESPVNFRINFMKAMFLYRKAIESLGGRYPTGETMEELQFRIPIGNAKRPRKWTEEADMKIFRFSADEKHKGRQGWQPSLVSNLLAIDEGHDQRQYEMLPNDVKDQIYDYWETAAVFASKIAGNQFCVTEKGYAGLVPKHSIVGDRICVFHGGKVPFVIGTRALGTESLKGECYIHGIMHGSALDGYTGGNGEVFRLI